MEGCRGTQSVGRVCRELKYVIKGFHLLWKLAVLPLTEDMIFSSLRLDMTSFSHIEVDGALGDFQNNRMFRLASKDVNANMLDCVGFVCVSSHRIPNIAVNGLAWIRKPKTIDRILK